jgi:ferric-dicitrate binding protein FerR (iron transport regulator)
MDQEKLADLIKRYKSGTATPEEIATLEKIWHSSSTGMSFTTDHTGAELENIEREMFKNIKSKILKREVRVRNPLLSRRSFYQAAATVLILLSVSLWWYANSDDIIKIQTGFGEHLTVTLPDQSSVVLNSNSVLRYSGDWDKKAIREVWIEGEGFFSITHTNDHQKFIVHAADYLDVEVLGTKFNVKARQSAPEVMLAEGKIKLATSDAQQVFLKPGELATLHNKLLSTRTVEKRQYTSWVENKLFFERTTLSEVAVLLKETYGLNVEFSDTDLQRRELSGEISSATEDDVLRAIAETFDLEVDRRGRSVVISLKHN